MSRHHFTARSTLAEVYAHPIGRDVIDRLLMAMRQSPALITNPIASRLSLAAIGRMTRKLTGPGLIEAVLTLLNSTPDRVQPTERPPQWWQSAVFYQIYPRSFADSDGDGIGDLRGIIDHLDHLTDLGVDCLWLSPIFDSPNADFGYDVRDYRAVMAEMGAMADLDELIAEVHRRGMRIILDLAVNHTSDQHPWFDAALADPTGPAGDYYFLRPGERGNRPNNWTSLFSGPAWRWFGGAEVWALRLFARTQPDLNWDNPQVRREIHQIMQFWAGKGVDGFRLDAINYVSKSPGLRDGNRFVGRLMGFTGIEHYFHGPRLHEYLRELRQAVADRPGMVLVGETPGAGVEIGRLLTNAGRGELDLNFGFDHLETGGHNRFDSYRYDLDELKHRWIDQQQRLGPGDWTSLFFENHDNPRMISKIDPTPAHRVPLAKLLATLLLTMRGTPFLYQGQEIAAINQTFAAPGQLRDVESLNRLRAGTDWATVMAGSRDHARVPMRWDTSPYTGFSTTRPWLPGREDSVGFTVAEQDADPDSVLNHYRELIRLRRAGDAFTLGDIEFVNPRRSEYFAWYRTGSEGRFLVECNLSSRRRPARHREVGEIVLSTAQAPGSLLEPYEATIYRTG
mgnify:CR=1 FL=1